MAVPYFRFRVCDPLAGTPLGYLDLQEGTFNEPVSGSAGKLVGKAFVGPTQDRDRLNGLTQHDMAIYAETAAGYWWGGTIDGREWNPGDRCREITATHWKAWPYQRYIGPNASVNPVADVVYGYTATEQLTIARAIMTYATAGAGAPTVIQGAETSGVTRDLNWLGSDFRYAGDLIDSMASREQGFEWTLAPQRDAVSGLPVLYFGLYYPQRGTGAPTLTFRKIPGSGNFSLEGRIADTAVDRRSQVWTTGAGSPPDRPMAVDSDPDIAAGTALLRETSSSYSSVTDVATLAQHARAERAFRSVPTNTVAIKVFFADLDPSLYGPGDRAQLIYEDEGVSLALPAVRIIDRAMSVSPSDGPPYAVLTLDLADFEMPDTAV